MKRCHFLKTIGVASVVLSSGSLLALPCFPGIENHSFSSGELRSALESHFSEMVSGKHFNPNVMPPHGKLLVVKSYSIEMNEQKNTVFDIADLLIDRLKQSGINARSLKKGKIPDGLEFEPGIIRLPGGGFPIRIKELKNYDATLILTDCYNIYTQNLPSEWENIEVTEKEKTPRGMDILRGKIGNNEFRLFHSEERKEPLQFRFNVSQISPKVVIDDFVPLLLGYETFCQLVSADVLEKI